jgi:REP element-mobilizing transposase RayT
LAFSFVMKKAQRKHLPHNVPIWIDPSKEAFFVTVCCRYRGVNQLAAAEAWEQIIESITHREASGDWQWRLVLAMPDHLHGIVTFPERFFPRRVMTDWKRWLAVRARIAWQDGFFEHRLRSMESAEEKARYIRLNPVRAGLVERAEDWPYVRDWKRGEGG